MNKERKKLDLTRETVVARLEKRLEQLEEAQGGACRPPSYIVTPSTLC